MNGKREVDEADLLSVLFESISVLAVLTSFMVVLPKMSGSEEGPSEKGPWGDGSYWAQGSGVLE